MSRPYVICHMTTSVDGKVTGNFLSHPACAAATEIYYEMNRAYMQKGASGFICGRITMEESFTGGYSPDLCAYRPIGHADFWPDAAALRGFYAIAFDPKGRLGWRSAFIADSDPGYDRAQIIEVLTTQADGRYLAYLREKGIPYFFAGEREIDVLYALQTLQERLGADTLILEGGSVINGHFLRADCVDEISVVQAPLTADAADKPLFGGGTLGCFDLSEVMQRDGVAVMRYRKRRA